jgi:hypothetical protein
MYAIWEWLNDMWNARRELLLKKGSLSGQLARTNHLGGIDHYLDLTCF